ncbi:MAG: sigma-70 family RNA polymerase sigma factor [Anaerolineae bacterium]|nr:sigma-70 family RNA polymerase sigma factor [Anaerolineae bacterium]
MTQDPILLEWIERAIHGDAEAFEEIYYTYKDDVYTACMRMLGNAAEAEDAAQEVFVRLLRVLPRYDVARASFRTWLLTITTNYCYDMLRKRRGGELSMDDEDNEAVTVTLRSSDPTPEQAALSNEFHARVQQMLDRLSPDDRQMIVLRYWFDHGYEEIAEATGQTVSAVKSRLFRARQRLADLLGDTPLPDEGD